MGWPPFKKRQRCIGVVQRFRNGFGLYRSGYASKAAFAAPKTAQTSLAEMCCAVLGERIFVQTRNCPQGILSVLPRTIAMYGRKDAHSKPVRVRLPLD